jgi:hypothetical protein
MTLSDREIEKMIPEQVVWKGETIHRPRTSVYRWTKAKGLPEDLARELLKYTPFEINANDDLYVHFLTKIASYFLPNDWKQAKKYTDPDFPDYIWIDIACPLCLSVHKILLDMVEKEEVRLFKCRPTSVKVAVTYRDEGDNIAYRFFDEKAVKEYDDMYINIDGFFYIWFIAYRMFKEGRLKL